MGIKDPKEMYRDAKVILTKTTSKKAIKLCIKCGFPISNYYFTAVTLENGEKLPTKCSNCGLFEDPE